MSFCDGVYHTYNSSSKKGRFFVFKKIRAAFYKTMTLLLAAIDVWLNVLWNSAHRKCFVY